MTDAMQTVGDVTLAGIPTEYQMKAEALMRIHGSGYYAREASGLHAYFASPKCLEMHGAIELEKRHLAVNLDKYFGAVPEKPKPGKRKTSNFGGGGTDNCAYCMKTSTPYSMKQLLGMRTIQERHPDLAYHVGEAKMRLQTSNWFVKNEQGQDVALAPGLTIPLTQLPADHPAVWYLKDRQFSLGSLEYQFGAEFCYQEQPEVREIQGRRMYHRMPGGFASTAQNRIVFYAIQAGARIGWQARVLEFTSPDGIKHYLHPYNNQWMPCEFKNPQSGKWEELDWLKQEDFAWEMRKYWNVPGMHRSELLFGIDAAVAWNQHYRPGQVPLAVLVEGPLDAARIGPPAMPLTGKNISPTQIGLLQARFGKLIFVRDQDVWGQKAATKIEAAVAGMFQFKSVQLPTHWKSKDGNTVKDPGDVTPSDLPEFLSMLDIDPATCMPLIYP